MKEEIKYFTSKGLIAVNRHAIRYKKNRSIRPNVLLGIIKHYGEDTKFPVVFDMMHNDCEVRCEVMLGVDEKNEPLKSWIDMDFKVYNRFLKTTR